MTDSNNTPKSFRPPTVFRVTGIHAESLAKGCRITVRLFHSQIAYWVTLHANQPDSRLVEGALVRVSWKQPPTPGKDVTEVKRVVVLERPEWTENLFQTVPASWVRNKDLLERAGDLWEGLSPPLKELFNRIFWEWERFYRYCQTQSSMRGHHAETSGNLKHSVDTAEAALKLMKLADGAHAGVLTLVTLLHDAGKADEYVLNSRGEWRMSDRGRLLGHRTTIIEWVAVAHSQMRLDLPEKQHVSLLHALHAVANAPDWTGVRKPMTPEAILLAAADRISGRGDLMARNQAKNGGWGSFHPHLNVQPYTVEPRRRKGAKGLDALWKYIQDEKAAGRPTTGPILRPKSVMELNLIKKANPSDERNVI